MKGIAVPAHTKSHRFTRSPLTLAVATGLMLASLQPAKAEETLRPDTGTLVARLFEDAATPARATAPLASLLQDPFSVPRPAQSLPSWSVQPAAGAQSGTLGDASSWITEEFEADWGLRAINAHYAYARGLTGAGVRLGVLDSGVGFDHSEFAGKEHRGIRIAETLGDGSKCADATVLAGPGACFFSDGGQVAISGEYYDFSLAPYIRPEYSYLLGQTLFYYNSHGTHVAGTIAANRDGSGMHGVAFGANLTSARLFNDDLLILDPDCVFLNDCLSFGTSADSTAFADMYAQMEAQGVRAINHSWGYTLIARTPDQVRQVNELLMGVPDIAATFTEMANASRRSGMLQVVAAGNSNPNPNPASSPHATAPATLPMIFPDIEQWWVSVVNVNSNLTLSPQSMKCGVTMNWCIAAPGSIITSSVYGDDDGISGDWVIDDDGNLRYEFENRTGTSAYADYSGTSMAAPHVTGALGLLFERFPYLSSAQIRDVMLTTATDLGAPGIDEIYGWGLLNLAKAIDGPGMLRVDTVVNMDRPAGGAKVWAGDAWDDWANDIGGPGHLTKDGAGWLRLSGSNSFAGATVSKGVLELTGNNALGGALDVDGGVFLLSGRLQNTALNVNGGHAFVNGIVNGGATYVGARGVLGGSGTLGNTYVAGTLAPGNSIGTLYVNGNYTQAAGSVFEAELQPPNHADLLSVAGSANLLGGTLRAIPQPGTYLLGQSYRILSASGGLTGRFDTLDASRISPFLALSLVYSANALDVRVDKGASLASEAHTFNQRSTATAADALAIDHGLAVGLTQLMPADARHALDQLSGEFHASARSALLENGRLIRDAAVARAANGQDGFTSQRDDEAATGAWVEVHRQGGSVAADGNAARLRHNGDSVLAGIDRQFESGWKVGAFGGSGQTDIDVRERGSQGDVDTRHVGLYVGQSWGGLGLRAGYAHAWHDVDSRRHVVFAGLNERVSAAYDATGWQAFIDAGWRFGNQTWKVEPYLQYAHAQVEVDGFGEQGGISALRGEGGEARVDLSTAGVRFNANLKGSQQQETWLSLRGNLGYRHAGGDQAYGAQVAWGGGSSFSVRSAAVGDEAVLVELGVAARLSVNTLLELGYSGAHADQARDHGATARFSWQF